MVFLAVFWLILCVSVLVVYGGRFYKKRMNMMQVLLSMYVHAIGLLLFPKYLGATDNIEKACFYAGLVLLGFSFVVIMFRTSVLSKKEDD